MESARDNWQSVSGEARIDSQLGRQEFASVVTRAFYHETDIETSIPSLAPPFIDSESFSGLRTHSGFSRGLQFSHLFDSTAEVKVTTNYQVSHITGPILPLTQQVAHIDAQHFLTVLNDTQLLYGLGYRVYHDHTDSNFAEEFDSSFKNPALRQWLCAP